MLNDAKSWLTTTEPTEYSTCAHCSSILIRFINYIHIGYNLIIGKRNRRQSQIKSRLCCPIAPTTHTHTDTQQQTRKGHACRQNRGRPISSILALATKTHLLPIAHSSLMRCRLYQLRVNTIV